MIVVAIIGILASLAMAAYQTFSVRAQVSEGVNMAAAAKTPVVDAFLQTGQPPAGRPEAGMSAAATDTKGKYVASVNIVDGRVDVTFGNDAHAEIHRPHDVVHPYTCRDRTASPGAAAPPTPRQGHRSAVAASPAHIWTPASPCAICRLPAALSGRIGVPRTR